MTFTDDDLKRLKEGMAQIDWGNCHHDIRALLARMEAAEQVCQVADIESGTPRGIKLPFLGMKIEVWRKSKGA